MSIYSRSNIILAAITAVSFVLPGLAIAQSPTAVNVPANVSTATEIPVHVQDRIKSLRTLKNMKNLLEPIALTPSELPNDNCPKPPPELTPTDPAAELPIRVVNPQRGFDADYVPPDLVDISDQVPTNHNRVVCLVSTAANQLIAMANAMSNEGLKLLVVSGYRSFGDQKYLYNKHAPSMNRGTYNRVAPAGRSEHQSGLALDVAGEFSSGSSFANSKEGKWIANNAHKYGFIVSYPKGQEDKTGYMYEPWHLNYVGPDNALVLREANYTLAFKQSYYQSSWLNKMLTNLKKKVGADSALNQSIGG